ncbi:MAG: YaiO family outer membrane beta-barrel protein [Candidatus Binatia bacterium]
MGKLSAGAAALIVGTVGVVSAAQATPDLDDRVRAARVLAFDGRRSEALEIFAEVLARDPRYLGARIFTARIHGWEGRYEAAREELERALEQSPTDIEAIDARIDIELWSGHPAAALVFCDRGLLHHPESGAIRRKRLKILASRWNVMGAPIKEARDRAVPLREPAPGLPAVSQDTSRISASLDYEYRNFNDDLDPWHASSFSLSRHSSGATVTARINYAERFGQSALQGELEAYPLLGGGRYAYLNAGYGDKDLFPEYRVAAELFQALPRECELSLGVKRLGFGDPVNLYTASLAKYLRSYYLAFRPTVTDSFGKQTFSWQLTTRRYFGDGEFAELLLAQGDSLERNATVDFLNIESKSAQLKLQKRITGDWLSRLIIGTEEQDLGAGSSRTQLLLGVGVEQRF